MKQDKIKVWVDDIRNAPDDSWVVVRNVTEAIRTIAKWDCEEISLDHDISHQVVIGKLGRPYPCDECFCAVAYFIAQRWFVHAQLLENGSTSKLYPKITLHTSNPVGAQKMENILRDYGIESVTKLSGISNRLEMEA